MSRHEGDFRAATGEPLSLEELIALFGAAGESGDRQRQAAIACYLSAGEGWAEAMKQLGGAFAPNGTKLRERKAD